MEKFFLQHNVLQDRDPDELGGHVNSDSEASDQEEEITERVHSVADPTGPWRQKPVDGETWGKPTRGFRGGKGRDFASANTGPKGVINDYKAHKRHQKEERLRKEAERQAVLNRIAKGTTVSSTSATQDPTTHLECECDGGSDCECDDSDLVDDAFLAQYAELRVKQMQEAASKRKVFGELEYITPDQFVALTSKKESSEAGNDIVVHLYHAENYACSLLNTQLELLARKLVHIKFTAMVAKEADASIEMADLPVMLIFRGQQQQEAVVDIARRLDGEFTLERVEVFVKEQLGL
ncbi:adp-ribosylation factor family [Phytophthora cinnamomi]|uniref:adp-ribosylation factor family n=1 Tax=Phytophthora cinnamomi TaxID=4785 RepID=UPI0035598B5E|nr:adp-ribosylation factor family [Phytophthora cinnamomi]